MSSATRRSRSRRWQRLQQSHDWVDLGRHFIPPPERLLHLVDAIAPPTGGRPIAAAGSIISGPRPKSRATATRFEVIEDARDWGKPSDHVPQIVTLEL